MAIPIRQHEFETPQSKSDDTQLTLDDPERAKAPLTSPFSVDSPSALDLKLEALQNFEDFLSIGNETTPAVPVPITSIYKKI